ncbi:acyltransferase family protein [Synechococcus sp. RS9907]|uniref:acyltransferase family protein n=1 Tax=Synechococcus sp. RS9907 TaxID=221350 RepID=UPI00165D4240|nr:acyltransferase family protein [Synechococcus sp. RS9907]QNI83321.1 acyltransferase family protein [Synechococcus sp. RS9907]
MSSSIRPNSVRYRPEIDGLRAFAVIAVIINHFNKDLLPSGYLGVDIFFVISGYVITSSLAGRTSKNFLDFLSGFYVRRIKRLVPALVMFVLITSVLISLFNPDPKVPLDVGWRSLFGISNIFLYQESTDYFAQSAELNPFTHTWSLGVEEQFYLLFPFLIWFSGFGRQEPKGARNLFLCVAVLTIASLIGFISLYPVDQPAAYFLMLPRFWEMAAGCLTFIVFEKRVKIKQALERVPPFLVCAAMVAVMFRPIGGRSGTIAIVFLSVILIACLQKRTAAYQIFTYKTIVYIGLISYSLYLWHWGILSISRWTIGVSWWSTPILLALIFIIAILSYEYIEKPLRKKLFNHSWGYFLIGASVLSFSAIFVNMLATPFVSAKLRIVSDDDGIFQKGRESQSNYTGPVTGRKNRDCGISASKLTQSVIHSSLGKCLWVGEDKRAVIAILGDSHAHQLFPIAENIANDKKLSVYNFQYSGCLVPQDPIKIDDKCENVNKVPVWVHRELGQPVIFVIASIADPVYHFHTAALQKERVEAFISSFKEVLDAGNYLIVVAPNPKFHDINNHTSDVCGRGGVWTKFNPDCKKEYKFLAKTQRDQRKVYLDGLYNWSSSDQRVAIVNPYDILCGEINGYCHAISHGLAKYWDASHLNLGAVQSTYPLYKIAVDQLLQVHAKSITNK